MLFGVASTKQVMVMIQILNQFCKGSGQKASLAKSRLLVSSNISSLKANLLSNATKIPLTKDLGKYLSTLMIHGRITRETYSELVVEIRQRLEKWSNKKPSVVGKI